jgi:type VI secretion system protein ImpA
MPSAVVLDFATLLAPIAGEHPTGADPRADPSPVSLYQMIKEDRKAARQIETRIDRGETVNGQPLSPPDWQPLIDKATRLLAEKTKDMEVTAYLIEALTRKQGFAGLRDGFRLARALIEQYWDGLFPSDSDPPDVESRFSHLLQLSGIDRPGTLIVPIRKVPFTENTSEGCFSLSHYQLAKSLSQISDPNVRQRKIDEGAVTLENIARAVSETPGAFYADLVDDINESREEFRKIGAALCEKSGYDPASSDLMEVLESYLDVVKELAGDKIPKPAPATAPAAATTTTTPGAPSALESVVENSATIRSRDDALERLVQIAEYFRRNEPHSIIPYALQQVVTWGKMSLPQLLAELIPDDGPRKELFKQVGIRPSEPAK